ncbi:MAG: glycosyltransferase family 2 protein, partial [Anaerolineales bacterium]
MRAYNEGRNIARLFTGIQQQTLDGVEVILVDSGSTDATVAIAKRF